MAHKFDHPTEGNFPTLNYIFEEPEHIIKCECGDHCRTNDEKMARHFAQVHTGDHARRRIVTPQPPEEP
jgi:hypothetical protein